MKDNESRPILKTETVEKATAYGRKHGLRMWAVYDLAVSQLVEQDEKKEDE